jgi:carbonic anhydrase
MLMTCTGPPTWGSVAPMAVHGKHQSPIDICPQEAQFDPTLTQRELWTTYVPANAHTLINLGHTFQVKIDGRGSSKCYDLCLNLYCKVQ